MSKKRLGARDAHCIGGPLLPMTCGAVVIADPQAAASIAIREAARGIIAATPVELPVMQAPSAPMPETIAVGATGAVSGTELPVIQSGG